MIPVIRVDDLGVRSGLFDPVLGHVADSVGEQIAQPIFFVQGQVSFAEAGR
ncbi:MAG TPA: hypothetical protein VMS08_02290 [Candidatus Saccharimonadia bacterium]|nr:hypothetical protein [Candidatus Saccharimonadia bacterium]